MCLITEQQSPFIAQKDMIVYKLLSNSLKAVHTGFKYESNKLNVTTIKESDDWCCFDSVGLKYLEDNFPRWETGKHDEKLKCFGEGFHSSLTKNRLLDSYDAHYHRYINNVDDSIEKLFECIIPKGSEYYLDATGLVISNQLIIKSKL